MEKPQSETISPGVRNVRALKVPTTKLNNLVDCHQIRWLTRRQQPAFSNDVGKVGKKWLVLKTKNVHRNCLRGCFVLKKAQKANPANPRWNSLETGSVQVVAVVVVTSAQRKNGRCAQNVSFERGRSAATSRDRFGRKNRLELDRQLVSIDSSTPTSQNENGN